MKRFIKKALCLVVVVCFILLSIVSLQPQMVKSAPPQTTLKLYFWGGSSLFKNVDRVISEFEKRTKNTLNIKLNLTIIPTSADYKDKMKMMVAAKEEMDLVFDAPWMNLNTFATQDVYNDLEKYFNNPKKYPGLYKAFPKDFLEANKFFGKLIAVPLTESLTDFQVVFYRLDLAKKYGLGELKNYDDLYKFMSLVQKNEKNIKTIYLGNAGWARAFKVNPNVEPNPRVQQVMSWVFTGAMALLSPDYKRVQQIAVPGEGESAFSAYPPPYNKLDTYLYYVKMARKFYPLVDKDSIYASRDNTPFLIGKYAVCEGNLSGFVSTQATLKQNVPGAELGVLICENKNVLAMKKGAYWTTMKVSNYVCVPKTSKKVDRVMQFLDWIFQNQENHDLFQFGIKNKDWIPVGRDQYKIPSVDPNNLYQFPGYQLTWNPTYVRKPADLPSEIKKWFDYQYRFDTYSKSPLAGFTFDQTPVKVEMAKISSIQSTYQLPLCAGLYPDPEAKVQEFVKRIKAAGFEKVRKELRKQLQAFLDQKYGGKK
ncbi:extracellular solute-binding protein, family 1 [Caldicellulosiruptor saccharolyticus DSM 8903]|uniref:Extracellular solute-binding protein, family 1 n=1 Tax=Caldicellulosiruptor saccharolyticus (strain ATCC 43494 / DSM 8903 / Tp8T 6331) TaxID=351627 RepID=A4XN09_CALS8|nr:DUF3502 domain-containing protein [Caldicellulosiruptor saccharolyticus]ABP68294.1 extracellular solute-binding protein, family 1 [Caldicellulosiruptor saccharolyticus DSM 8903]